MRLTTRAAVAGATAVGALLLMAPSALADGDPSDCGPGYACLWVDIHYTTDGSRYTHLDTSLWRATLPTKYNHEASSAYNNGTNMQAVYLYKPQKCAAGGDRFSIAAPSGDSDFTNGSPPGNYQDAVRSLVFASNTLITDCQQS